MKKNKNTELPGRETAQDDQEHSGSPQRRSDEPKTSTEKEKIESTSKTSTNEHEVIHIEGCILPWHIRNLVRTTGITYLDPIPGMLILKCMRKTKWKRKVWLRIHFPDMDENTKRRFDYISEWIDEVPSFLCMGWERLMILLKFLEKKGKDMEEELYDLLRSDKKFKDVHNLRDDVDGHMRDYGCEECGIYKGKVYEVEISDDARINTCGLHSGL